VAEVNILGIFGNRFLKESFSLDLEEKLSIKKFFSKIDRHLKVRLFKKIIRRLPDGVITLIMINGQLVHSPAKYDVPIKDSDQVSIIRIIAGG